MYALCARARDYVCVWVGVYMFIYVYVSTSVCCMLQRCGSNRAIRTR